MAWSISISEEGWSEIRQELHNWKKEELVEAIADDYLEQLEEQGFSYPDPKVKHKLAKLKYKLLVHCPRGALINKCFELVVNNNTCDNGGYAYWIDREGYNKVYLSDD